jgi:hypothetical protein
MMLVNVPTFSMETVTPTRCNVPDPGEDNHINIHGSAGDWRAIGLPNFLPVPTVVNLGGPGPHLVDQVLVKGGDQSAQVAKGNRWVEILQGLQTKIHGKEIRHVDQGRETIIAKTIGPSVSARGADLSPNVADFLKVKGIRRTVITGNLSTETLGNEYRTVVGCAWKIINGGELENETTNWFRHFGDRRFEYGRAHGIAAYDKVEASGVALGLGGAKADLALIDISMKTLEPEMKVGWLSIGVAKLITGGVSNKSDVTPGS